MEDYKKIYPELLTKEPPKDGNTFRLQQSCRVLENLEKRSKTLLKCQEKVQKMLQLIVENQHIIRNSFVLSQRVWSWNSIFWVGLPLAASLGGLGLICGVVSVITGEAGKNVSRKVTKHEKTVSVCESKINSLKDRISKALADDRISNEEFENILAEMSKYHELKKDIRVGFKKTRSKKRWKAKPDRRFWGSKSITPRDSCGNTQKTSIRRRPSKIEASCFCFLRRYDSGEVCDSDEISLRPPPYNPDF